MKEKSMATPTYRNICEYKCKTSITIDSATVSHKSRLVAKGFCQRQGIDCDEIFSPVAHLETIRLVISLTAQSKWKIYQMDVKSAFLNGYLEE